jgi:Kef-type K+ transport system membrane component KefB
MGLEFQRFYRFFLPGAILVASDCIILINHFNVPIDNVECITKFILLLAVFAIIAGVPLYWIFLYWHILFEQNDMQSKEVGWLNTNEKNLSKDDIYEYSHIIWHYLDSKKDYEQNANWFRNNLLLMSSIGASIVALIIGIIVILIYLLCKGDKSIPNTIYSTIIWVIMYGFLYYYRAYLKKRLMKRLEIFIRINSKDILAASPFPSRATESSCPSTE